jgi:hypothetical protein
MPKTFTTSGMSTRVWAYQVLVPHTLIDTPYSVPASNMKAERMPAERMGNQKPTNLAQHAVHAQEPSIAGGMLWLSRKRLVGS